MYPQPFNLECTILALWRPWWSANLIARQFGIRRENNQILYIGAQRPCDRNCFRDRQIEGAAGIQLTRGF